MMTKERAKQILRIKEILASHGIKMSVGGCGCCESPWVSFSYQDEMIVDGGENFNFDMF